MQSQIQSGEELQEESGTENSLMKYDRFISEFNETYGAPKEQLEEIFPPIKQGILWCNTIRFLMESFRRLFMRWIYMRIFEILLPIGILDSSCWIHSRAKKKRHQISLIILWKKVLKLKVLNSGIPQVSTHLIRKKNVIYKGIASIKYLNSKVADAFQSIKDMEFQDFIHLLAVVKEKSLPVNSKQMKILIQLNFFWRIWRSKVSAETVWLLWFVIW